MVYLRTWIVRPRHLLCKSTMVNMRSESLFYIGVTRFSTGTRGRGFQFHTLGRNQNTATLVVVCCTKVDLGGQYNFAWAHSRVARLEADV
jgi:hypothetical protein